MSSWLSVDGKRTEVDPVHRHNCRSGRVTIRVVRWPRYSEHPLLQRFRVVAVGAAVVVTVAILVGLLIASR